ncbi:AraC family transcriptional regulator [Kitasatospora sp. Ki12]|uniref:AraC family transcriptional regulator n=1 Tax=Kitasatospora xanthocidica TaxID=83382 RepID=UPI001672BC81|nr:AraC family transcriptional regulator [Kitasatospora xanthocidica]
MDVLSDVVATLRTGEPRSARVAWRAPWGQRFPGAPGAGFQVILRGSCWLVPDSGEPLRLAAGDVLFLPRGHGHALADHPGTPLAEPRCEPLAGPYTGPYTGAETGARAEPDTVTLCGAYQLDPVHAHPLLRDVPDVLHLAARPGRHPELRAAVGLLAGELESPRPGAAAVVPALLDTLLMFILRAWSERSADGPEHGWAAALADPALGRALQAVHAEPGRSWTVGTLAAEAGLSRAAFARRFTAAVGRPPLGYVTWWRMALATRLLRDSDLPLGVLAARVGYTSEFAFSHAFKRHHGLAPGRYRSASA